VAKVGGVPVYVCAENPEALVDDFNAELTEGIFDKLTLDKLVDADVLSSDFFEHEAKPTTPPSMLAAAK
jgi:hypothetical protein